MNNLKIENNYHDAMFFASATINKQKDFYITDGEFRLLTKLIHYAKNDPSITWSSENISKHIFTTDDGIDKVIQRLKRKGYINTVTKNIDRTNKKRTITINWEKFEALNKLIEAYQSVESEKETEPTPPAAPEPVQQPELLKPALHVETPSFEIEPSTSENKPAQPKDNKRDAMEQRFNDKFRYGLQGRSLTPAEFHNLTFDKFKEIPKVWNKISNLPNNDFDLFWLKVQELKAVLATSDVLTQQQKELLDIDIRMAVNQNLLRTTARTVVIHSAFIYNLLNVIDYKWVESEKHLKEINDYIYKNYKRILKEMILNEKEFDGIKNNITGNEITIKYMSVKDSGKEYVDCKETITRND